MRNFLVLMLAVATTLLTMSCEPPKLAVGGTHGCGISGGKVHCTGNSSSYQTGNSNTSNKLIPTEITDPNGDLDNPNGVWAGRYHTCVTTDGTYDDFLWCFGANNAGQLGNGSNTSTYIPQWVGHYITDVDLGDYHSAAIDRYGYLYTTGENGSRQLGIYNSTTDQNGFDWVVLKGTMGTQLKYNGSRLWATGVAAGKEHTCVILPTTGAHTGAGYVFCTGRNNYNQVSPSGSSTINGWYHTGVYAQKVYAGGYTTCSTNGGGLTCWGYNAGYFYDGDLSEPTYITDFGGGIDKVAMNLTQLCTLNSDGDLNCAGYGFSPSYDPVTVDTDVSDVSLGYTWNACYAREGNEAECWGHNYYGQLGNNSTTSTTPPNTVTARVN